MVLPTGALIGPGVFVAVIQDVVRFNRGTCEVAGGAGAGSG